MVKYDLIVVGAGHAGIEASYAAAKMGCEVLLLTIDIDAIGKLSCNPAVGGVSKGNLVREVDAFGGAIGRLTDQSALGYRILNKSKGKAVWSTRAQVDMYVYPKRARELLENNKNIRILQAKVSDILVKNNKVYGVRTNFGEIFNGKSVAICAGTFLKGKIHIGLNSFSGGRIYEESSDCLFKSIKNLGLKTKFFKTGTCARVDKRTINFSKMIEQKPDEDALPFSFLSIKKAKEAISCFITHTNSKTHKVILSNLKYSPLYTGKIKSIGVRYCPSLEDKVVKFSDRPRHQVFIEPQGKDSLEVYPNGISTSLPFDVQVKFIHTIEGLEKASVMRPGYGIEHGLIYAQLLDHTLQVKSINGLYFAGQVNGTTGYEEAAAQGLIAGINAALNAQNKKPFILSRSDAFIGVLIDDLVTKGTDEPYRMFTARSELRLSLRETNARFRISSFAYNLHLISKNDLERAYEKERLIEAEIKKLQGSKGIIGNEKINLFDALKRPEVSYDNVSKKLEPQHKDEEIKREIEIRVKYKGFLQRESIWLKKLKNIDKIKLPKIDFSSVPSLPSEAIEKLNKVKPKNLKEALEISGITPAAILNIYNFIQRNK